MNLRTFAAACVGWYWSSRMVRLILRPLTPAASLTDLKYASSARLMFWQSDPKGPLTGVVMPSSMVVAVTPASVAPPAVLAAVVGAGVGTAGEALGAAATVLGAAA